MKGRMCTSFNRCVLANIFTIVFVGMPSISHAVESVLSLAPGSYYLVTRDKAERRFERKASKVYAASYEAIRDTGIAVGLQAMTLKLDYRVGIARYEAETDMVSILARQYLNHQGQARFYYGISAGVVVVDTNEPKGNYAEVQFTGAAYQFGTGFLYTWENIGFGLDYTNRYIRVGDGRDDLSLSGWGLAVGVKLRFGRQ